MERYSKILALKNLLQQGQQQSQLHAQAVQENQMKLQQMKKDLADSEMARRIFDEAGGNLEVAQPKLLKALGPNALPLLENFTKHKQAVVNLNRTQAEAAAAQLKPFSDTIDEIAALDPPSRTMALRNKLKVLSSSGLITPEQIEQLPKAEDGGPLWDDDLMSGYGSQLKRTQNDLDMQIKRAGLREAAAQATREEQTAAGTTPITPYQRQQLDIQRSSVTEVELALRAAQGDATAGKALGIMVQNRIKEAQGKLPQGYGASGVSAAYAGAPGGQAVRNEEVLSGLPTGEQNIIKGMIEGRIAMPTGMAASKEPWVSRLQRAAEYEPGFDQSQWRVRLDTRVDFAKGNAARQIRSLNTLIKHLGTVWDAIDTLDNMKLKMGNRFFNFIKSETGSKDLKPWQTAATAAASEMATLLKGGAAPSEGEIEEQEKAFDMNDSKGAQQQAVLNTLELAFGRFDAVKEQWRNAFRQAPDFKFINEGARHVLIDKLKVDPKKVDEGAGGVAGQAGPAVGTVSKGYRFKGGDPSAQSSWEKVVQ